MSEDGMFIEVEVDDFGQVPACIDCGVLIADTDGHRRWHESLEPEEAQRQMQEFKRRLGA